MPKDDGDSPAERLGALIADRSKRLLLGRSLFEYQESVLPEGETWEMLGASDQSYWAESAATVLRLAIKLSI